MLSRSHPLALGGFVDHCDAHTEGVYRDSSDGSIIQEMMNGPHASPDCWPFQVCSDAVVRRVVASTNLVPIVVHCHALPPHMRTTHGAVYLAAVCPHSAKMTQVFWEPVIAMFERRCLVQGSPLEVLDPAGNQQRVSAWISPLAIVNDLPGPHKASFHMILLNCTPLCVGGWTPQLFLFF